MQKIDEILKYLAQCEPYHPAKDKKGSQRKVQKAGTWLLVLSGLCFGLLVGLALVHKYLYSLPEWLRGTAIVICVISMLLAVFSLLAGIISDIIGLYSRRKGRQKQGPWDPIHGEVETDDKHARTLTQHSEEALKYAQHCLKLRIARIDGRIALFLGEKVAVVSLFVGAFSQIKEMGGVSWLSAAFEQGITPGNYLNAMGLAALALGVGLLLGGMALKLSQRRYTYQLELIELALLLKTLTPATSPTNPNRQVAPDAIETA
ncbi:hypothetical protein [Paraburkholderia youngii]|uniref:hypothetical protein n=1 Tax=Paraburkholderia youngii TaxID=2782701 RepID=UPI003D22E74C